MFLQENIVSQKLAQKMYYILVWLPLMTLVCVHGLCSLDCIRISDSPNVKEDDKAIKEFNRTAWYVCYLA